MLDKYKCVDCEFPFDNNLGKIIFWTGVSKESILRHYKKKHPDKYDEVYRSFSETKNE